jgi:hypothetical protein
MGIAPLSAVFHLVLFLLLNEHYDPDGDDQRGDNHAARNDGVS